VGLKAHTFTLTALIFSTQSAGTHTVNGGRYELNGKDK
jgi:hypothetical protein